MMTLQSTIPGSNANQAHGPIAREASNEIGSSSGGIPALKIDQKVLILYFSMQE